MNRKVRKDSILHGLPVQQRARVHKWLFDKGLTYAKVAEACGVVLGVKVSKSSVARYHERVSRERVKGAARGWREMGRTRTCTDGTRTLSTDHSGNAKVVALTAMTPEEKYQWMLQRLVEAALVEADLPREIRDDRFLCELLRVIIAARRERNQQVRVSAMRTAFEMKKAREVLECWRKQQSKVPGPKSKVEDGGKWL